MRSIPSDLPPLVFPVPSSWVGIRSGRSALRPPVLKRISGKRSLPSMSIPAPLRRLSPPFLALTESRVTVLIFQARFPLQPGLRYRAVFASASEPITLRFDIPKSEATVSTTVEHVYPSTDRLPENQLKFYLHFSAPMSRGEAYSRIQFARREEGSPLICPFWNWIRNCGTVKESD